MGTYASLNADDFAEAIFGLLPTGLAWSRDSDSYMSAFVHGVADGFAYIHAQAYQLSEIETDPRTTSAMLADWENTYGLPDPCVTLQLAEEVPPGVQTTEQRRNALVQRITAKGGQSIAYYTGVAAALGYAIEITEFSVFKVDFNRMGDSVPTEGFLFNWLVTVHSAINIIFFTVDHSTCVDPLEGYAQTPLQCLFDEIKPAHTNVRYAFV